MTGAKSRATLARAKQLYDTQQQIIDQMQESQRDSAHREARMDAKFNELYASLGYERSHSLALAEWYRNGRPDRPGKPQSSPPRPSTSHPIQWLNDEVPDHLKDPDHTVHMSAWETIRADAAVVAQEARSLRVDEPTTNMASSKHLGKRSRTQMLVVHSPEIPLQAGYAASVTCNWLNLAHALASINAFFGPDTTIRAVHSKYAA